MPVIAEDERAVASKLATDALLEIEVTLAVSIVERALGSAL